MHIKNAERCLSANIVIITAAVVIIDFDMLEYIFNLEKKVYLKQESVHQTHQYTRNSLRYIFF